MDILDTIELQDCPVCHGAGSLEDEYGWCMYVVCLECGCHSAEIEYKSPAERETAARQAADIWNMGKVVPESSGY